LELLELITAEDNETQFGEKKKEMREREKPIFEDDTILYRESCKEFTQNLRELISSARLQETRS
jgi:hypothetical protein